MTPQLQTPLQTKIRVLAVDDHPLVRKGIASILANESDMHFLWFYILGMKLLVLGVILFTRGAGYFLDHR